MRAARALRDSSQLIQFDYAGIVRRLSAGLQRFVLACGLVLAIASCSHDPLPIESVEAPPDLAQLDLSVRQQFERVWNEGRLPDESASGGRGNWGELAQWFHVYRYQTSAIRCYRNAMLLEPGEPRWPYLLALLEVEQGNPERARTLFQTAAALAPEATQVRVQLADLARSQGDVETAELRYREALALRPTDSGARFGMGQLALQRGEADTALEWLVPLNEEQPDAAELNYALGMAWRLAGDSARAEAKLKGVPDSNLHQTGLIREDPWLAEMMRMDEGARQLTRLGIRAASRGDNGQAAMLFGVAAKRDPDGAEERLNWALALAKLGHHADASAQIKRAVALAESGSDLQANARLEAARIESMAGRPRQAEAGLRALLAERPTHSRARVELARLLHSRGDLEGALKQYQALREANAFGADTAFWQSAARLALDQRDAAFTQLAADIPRFPESSKLQLLLSRLIATRPVGGADEIRAALEQTISRLNKPPTLLEAESLAMLYAGVGDYPKAMEWQQAAVDTLAVSSTTAPLRIAHRRLALYREGKRPSKGWEISERPVELHVRQPYPASFPVSGAR